MEQFKTAITEVFKPIEGFPNYQVSNLGRIFNVKKQQFKKPTLQIYHVIVLFKDGKGYKKYTHTLIAKAFKHNPEGFKCVNHLDEDTKNNDLNNLQYCTKIFNENYGTRNERIAEKHRTPVCQFSLDGKYIATFKSMTEVEKTLGFNHSCISQACNGKQKTAYKYKWAFKEGIINIKNLHKIKPNQINKNDDRIGV